MSAKKHTLLLGAHVSIAGGLENAITRGESIGCTCIQIFTKSNRQWNAKKITNEQAELFKKTAQSSTIPLSRIITHASYLINIGSSNEALAHKSIAALVDELERCDLLGIPYLVLHPGASVDASLEKTLENISKSLDIVFKQFKGSTLLLLETMSGQGSGVCYKLEQLAQIIKTSHHKARLGVCVDTCHIFAAGYHVDTPEGYQAFWQQFDDLLGLNHLYAIHINDSKGACGSRIDRHADIGKGAMGLPFFTMLFNDKRFFDILKTLETPETDDVMKDYARNMEIIRGLISKESKAVLQMT